MHNILHLVLQKSYLGMRTPLSVYVNDRYMSLIMTRCSNAVYPTSADVCACIDERESIEWRWFITSKQKNICTGYIYSAPVYVCIDSLESMYTLMWVVSVFTFVFFFQTREDWNFCRLIWPAEVSDGREIVILWRRFLGHNTLAQKAEFVGSNYSCKKRLAVFPWISPQ